MVPSALRREVMPVDLRVTIDAPLLRLVARSRSALQRLSGPSHTRALTGAFTPSLLPKISLVQILVQIELPNDSQIVVKFLFLLAPRGRIRTADQRINSPSLYH